MTRESRPGTNQAADISTRTGEDKPRINPAPDTAGQAAAKAQRPETLAEYKHWERLTTMYQRAGLCRACAGQVAYGHQLGFTTDNLEPDDLGLTWGLADPCLNCQPIVESFPIGTANRAWRRLPGRPYRGSSAGTPLRLVHSRSEGEGSGPGSPSATGPDVSGERPWSHVGGAA